jgi:putative nucleotidyltransferase with HDIG domain
VDSDGVIRNLRSFVARGRAADFSFDLKVASAYLDSPFDQISIDKDAVSLGSSVSIPASLQGISRLNYLFLAHDFKTVSAAEVLAGNIPAYLFKEKIVLIGPTARIIHDEHPTSLGNLSGVAILANSISMILNGAYLRAVPAAINFFLLLVLGVFILIINRSYLFFKNTVFTLLTLLSLSFLMVYLRSRGIQFDYFSLFFLLISAAVISNIYKYTYLIFMGTRLKNLAVIEPLTGFYTLRYFSLRLNEAVRRKEKKAYLVALGVLGYTNLIKQYSFDETKSFLKSFSSFLESKLSRDNKSAIFACLSEGMFLVLIRGKKKDKVKAAIEELILRSKDVKFQLGEDTACISLRASLVYGLWSGQAKADNLVGLSEAALKELMTEGKEAIAEVDARNNVWQPGQGAELKDSFDFLFSDLEARNRQLEDSLREVRRAQAETEEAYLETMRSLIKALEEKDTYTQGHSERVARYALKMAREDGLSEDECHKIYKAGLLHDIGKIGIPDNILRKKEKLTDEEFAFIRKHEILSVEILKPVKAFKDLLPLVLHHHEWFNGTGYPHGLSADMIPRGAQILIVADCFDAITSGRGYKEGKSLEESFAVLEKNSGTQFNPHYVTILKRVLKI